MTLADRFDILLAEAQRKGVEDEVHQFDLAQAILAYAELLGYRTPEAVDLELPLIKE